MSDLPVKKSYGFQLGVSGNLLGRPKTNIELRDVAREYTQDCLDVLTDIAANKRSPSSARVNASIALLDHAWGKPLQHVDSVKARCTIEEYLDSLKVDDVDELEAREAGIQWEDIMELRESAEEEDYTADL